MKLRSTNTAAFTLIELMISIALVVILMLGITKVFSLTSQTAGATNQVSASLRDARAAQEVLRRDFANSVGEGSPCIILHSTALPAFRNKADRDGDRDFNPSGTQLEQWQKMLTVDLDGDNAEGTTAGEDISPSTYNNRNHRLDTISFFTRQRQKRQTGGAGTTGFLVDRMTSNEAWVWYGHLWLPNNSGAWPPPPVSSDPAHLYGEPSATFPGQKDPGVNPNNYYATQWILGRVSMLLTQPSPITNTYGVANTIVDLSLTPRRFIRRDPPPNPPLPEPLPLSPLQVGAYDANHETNATTITGRFEDARYDLAGTSIDVFRQQLSKFITPTIDWWSRMMGIDRVPAAHTYNNLPASGRFKANPFVPSEINPETLAKQSPILLPGCTQFIVEYAGDFLKQDNAVPTSSAASSNQFYGQVIDEGSDGQIDYVVNWADNPPNNGVIDVAEKHTIQRQIRWYGLPRDTDGAAGISGYTTGSSIMSNQLKDVIPIRDVMFSARNSTSPNLSATFIAKLAAGPPSQVFNMPFERYLPVPANDYSGTSLPIGAKYVCAWGPTDPKPKMIRIIMTIDDPAGKLAEGQTYQFVYTIP